MTAGDARPALRVVSGSPTAEELAIVTALVSAAASAPPADSARPARLRGTWNDPARTARRTLRPGPNAWRSSGW
jgi:hypothetical protein